MFLLTKGSKGPQGDWPEALGALVLVHGISFKTKSLKHANKGISDFAGD